MPGLTIATDISSSPSTTQASANPQSQSPSGSSSPSRPPISPITPTLPTARLPSGPPPPPANIPPFAAAQRQTFTHAQPDQVAITAPRPEPIDFESNPDVLALKSAISILQLQRRKATADIQALSAAKNEATSAPEAFLSDLAAGKVRTQGDKLIPSDDDEDDDGDHDNGEPRDQSQANPVKPDTKDMKDAHASSQPRAWSSLPKPQNIVRCPPINWSQYAVVGESLDKLHADQVARPSQGTPAVISPGGTFEFKGDTRTGGQKDFVGVAAPYTPGRDKLDKRPKGGKR